MIGARWLRRNHWRPDGKEKLLPDSKLYGKVVVDVKRHHRDGFGPLHGCRRRDALEKTPCIM